MVTTSLSAVSGGVIGATLSPAARAWLAAFVFLAVAAWSWMASGSDAQKVLGRSRLAAIGVLVGAELGDKTMFATAGLGAEFGALPVWLRASIGMATAGLLAVAVGARVGRWLAPQTLRVVTSAVFLVVAVSFVVVAMGSAHAGP